MIKALLIGLGILICFITIIIIMIKKKNNSKIILSILTIIYLLLVFSRVFFKDNFTRLSLNENSILNHSITTVTFIIYTFYSSLVLFLFAGASGRIKSDSLREVSKYFGIIISILMICFSPFYLQISINDLTLFVTPLRVILFLAECYLGLAISILMIIVDKTKIKLNKQFFKSFSSIIPLTLLMLPHGIISFFFGSIGSNLKPISIYQVIMVFSIIILFVVLYILLIKKSKDEKYNAILLMSLALVLQYFKIYTYSDIKLWNLPIHICNLGTLLILISVVFKLRGLFLFTYYINVFGATVALMIPLINDDFLSFPTFNFMFEHALVLIIPILSVIIGVNERPKIKEISKIIPLFTGYYLFSIIIGSIFYIYDRNVNYFYVIKDTIANFVVFLKPLRNITFNIGKAVFYPVYYFVIYLGIIALMYIMNFIYLYVYSLEDTRVEIRKVKEREENLLKKRKKEKLIKPNSDLILEVKNLTKIYPNGFKALSKVSLSLKKGDILWLLGHNGAGKSTLIKCITKIIEKTEGEVFIGGINIDSLSNQTKLMTGYCSDDHCQYEKLTPIEYLDYILNIYQIEGDHKQIITKYLELLNLIYVKDSLIETFSHGMKQKLSIIASIIHEPKLLVLDEPLSGLDIPTLKEIKGFLTNYALQGNSIIYSAHQYDVSDPLCNRVICLDKGKILSNFNVDTVEDLDHLKNEYINIGYNKGTL